MNPSPPEEPNMNRAQTNDADNVMDARDHREWVAPPNEAVRLRRIQSAVRDRVGHSQSVRSWRRWMSNPYVWGPSSFVLGAGLVALAVFSTVRPPHPQPDAAHSRSTTATPEQPELWQDTNLHTEQTSRTVRLADESTIDAQPHTFVENISSTSSQVVLALHRGSATFDVAKNPARRFWVMADDVRVEVVGTRFSVRRQPADPHTVEVSVSRGRVLVHTATGTSRTLDPGDQVRTASRAPKATPSLEDNADAKPRVAGHARAHTKPRATPKTAAELIERGSMARQSGRIDDALAAYETLLRLYPRDARAALAAFELGRLHMDKRRNLRSAARAFETALRDAPNSVFSEDARARLVQIYDRLGPSAQCVRKQRDYIASHPSGRHMRKIRLLCEK